MQVEAGDVVHVAAGVYRETVLPRQSGTADAPIRFVADAQGCVLVSGADRLRSTWTRYQGNIWVTATSTPVTQLFVEGRAMVDARWPNTALDHLVDAPLAQAGFGSTAERLVAPDLPDVDWTGASISAVPGAAWFAFVRRIDSYDRATHTAMFSAPLQADDPALPLTFEPLDDYFLYGSLAALDAEAEWFFDAGSSRLYLSPPGGADPNGLAIETRVRDAAFDLRRRDHIQISGFRLFSACIDASTASGTIVEDVHVRYPTHSFAAEGYMLADPATCRLGSESVWRRGSVAQSSHSGLLLLGSDARVEDAVFHDTGYARAPSGAISTLPSQAVSNVVITHNSIFATAGIGIFFDALQRGALSYNSVSDSCLLIVDCGPLYAWNTNGLGTSIDHNVVSGARWDTTSGIYLDDGSYGYVIHHNVILGYGLAGIGIKGPSDVLNNTVLPSGLTPIGYTPPTSAVPAPTDLRTMLVANNVFAGSPPVVATLTLGPVDDAAYFKHPVVATPQMAPYEVRFAELRLQTQAAPRPFDLTLPRSLQLVPGSTDGTFDLWLDDVALVGRPGVPDLLLDDFDDGDSTAAIGADWWSGAGEGSSIDASFTLDPTDDSGAVHLTGDQAFGGWVTFSLDLSQIDLGRYSGIRFRARSSGTARVTSPDGNPAWSNNASCPLTSTYAVSDECGIDRGLEHPPITDGFSGTAPDLGAFETGAVAWTAGSSVQEPSWQQCPAGPEFAETWPPFCADFCNIVVDAGCAASTQRCAEACDFWRVPADGGSCDCSMAAEALLEHVEASVSDVLACQDDPVTFRADGPGLDALQAYQRCAANHAPCSDWRRELIDDFEDANLMAASEDFASWSPLVADGSSVFPDPLVTQPGAGIDGGSALELRGATPGYATLYLPVRSRPLDLSRAVGVGFYARGSGELRAGVSMSRLVDAANWDNYGSDITLTRGWQYHVVLFSDATFAQSGYGAAVPFDPSDIDGLSFGVGASDAFELAIDDLALLLTPSPAGAGADAGAGGDFRVTDGSGGFATGAAGGHAAAGTSTTNDMPVLLSSEEARSSSGCSCTGPSSSSARTASSAWLLALSGGALLRRVRARRSRLLRRHDELTRKARPTPAGSRS